MLLSWPIGAFWWQACPLHQWQHAMLLLLNANPFVSLKKCKGRPSFFLSRRVSSFFCVTCGSSGSDISEESVIVITEWLRLEFSFMLWLRTWRFLQPTDREINKKRTLISKVEETKGQIATQGPYRLKDCFNCPQTTPTCRNWWLGHAAY